jgi:hypothetical protein
MKILRDFILVVGVAVGGLFLIVWLTGQSRPAHAQERAVARLSDQPRVYRVDDPARGVSCYVYAGYNLHCVRTHEEAAR